MLLNLLYRGPYKVFRRSEKFVVLQIWNKSDSDSVDRMELVISATPVTPAVLPPGGWSCLVPAFVLRPPDPVPLPEKKVRFKAPVPAMELSRNPCRMVQGSPPLSAVLTFWGE